LPARLITESVRLFQNIPNDSDDFNTRKECEIIAALKVILCAKREILIDEVRRAFCTAKTTIPLGFRNFAIGAH
jgi:hypothetical protein